MTKTTPYQRLMTALLIPGYTVVFTGLYGWLASQEFIGQLSLLIGVFLWPTIGVVALGRWILFGAKK